MAAAGFPVSWKTLIRVLIFAARHVRRIVARLGCFFGRILLPSCRWFLRLRVFRRDLAVLRSLSAVLFFRRSAHLFGQLARALFHLGLIILQSGRVIPSLGPALHGPLQAQQPLDFLDVFAISRLFIFQPIGTVLAQQEVQQGLQVGDRFFLLLECTTELRRGSQKLRGGVELLADETFGRLFDGAAQQSRPLRIAGGLDLCHPDHQLLEPCVLVSDAALLDRQTIGDCRRRRIRRCSGRARVRHPQGRDASVPERRTARGGKSQSVHRAPAGVS